MVIPTHSSIAGVDFEMLELFQRDPLVRQHFEKTVLVAIFVNAPSQPISDEADRRREGWSVCAGKDIVAGITTLKKIFI